MPSLGMGPWVQLLIFNFLKIELKGCLLPVRGLFFLAQGCNSTPAIPAPLAKEKTASEPIQPPGSTDVISLLFN